MGSEGSRLAESERGAWFWLKRYSICTPHFNRKYKLILFRGRKTDSAPKFWSPGASNGGMVSFTIAQAAPHLVAAVVPAFGLPLLGQLKVPPEASTVPYMFLSGAARVAAHTAPFLGTRPNISESHRESHCAPL